MLNKKKQKNRKSKKTIKMNQHRGHPSNRPKVQRKKLFATVVEKKDTTQINVQRKGTLH